MPLLLALAACSEKPSDAGGIRKELAELHKELDELVKVRAEMCGALDDLGTQVRRLREKTWPPPPPILPASPSRPASAAGEFYWVLSPTMVKGEARTALALYRAKSSGFELDSVRIVEEDVIQALPK